MPSFGDSGKGQISHIMFRGLKKIKIQNLGMVSQHNPLDEYYFGNH